jgi:signal transduction histidine kinase
VAALDLDLATILIIEDEEAHFQLMKRAIEKELPLASVHHLDNAAVCFDELDGIRPDVIVVDYLMPGMNGIEFLTALRQMDRSVPVVMTTGQGDERIAVQAMKLGAQDYLVKSADFFMHIPGVLRRVVREERLKHCLRQGARLNELLLDSLPYPAMLINRDRIILAAYHIAEAMSAHVGQRCWKAFSQRDGNHEPGGVSFGGCACERRSEKDTCAFCRADGAFLTKRAANCPEVSALGRLWDMWWIPIDTDTCLHYAIDITERRQTELAVRSSREQLRLLSTRLMEVQEEERKRISRELHDSIGSSLSAIKMYLENTLDQMQQGSTYLESFKTIISMTQDTINESRRIMTELRPAILDDVGILATLRWFCRTFKTVHPDMHIEERLEILESEIPEPLKIVVLRIVQEAFHNIAKYSRAGSVTLSLRKNGGTIELTVRDNGIGFDPASMLPRKELTGGVGLTSMKERAKLSGGGFRVTSRKGEGTAVSASWTLVREEILIRAGG